MKARYTRSVFVALILCTTAIDAHAQTFFTAHLTAEQAGVEGQPDAVGTAALALTDDGLRYFVTVDGLSGDISAAHFHEGEIGVGGGVVRAIDFSGNHAEGIWRAEDAQPLTDELMTALLTGQLYINVHTQANPGGEIRGQVLPSSGTTLAGALTPEQETADVESEGTGTVVVQLTDAGAIYYATVHGLTGPISAAHFHLGEVGVSGGVVRATPFEGNTALGLWTEDDDQPLVDSLVVHLLLGNLYMNVHTDQYGAGEIRGQLTVSGGVGFSALLNSENEPDEVVSDGQGTGSFVFTDAGLIYRVTVSELTGEIAAAHFHNAPAGVNGGVVRAITFEGNTAAGIWRPSDDQALTPALIQELIAGNLYVNVHTPEYGGGEIRGQVLMDEGTHLTAALTFAQSSGAVPSEGTGTGALTVTDEGVVYQVTIDGLTGDISAAHFHEGADGVDGGVVRAITFEGNTASGIWTAADDQALTDELLIDLLTGNLYINVHTSENPSGEIRGQVRVGDGAGLGAFLTNEQETDEVTQEGGGTAAMTLTEAGLIYRATVSELSGDLSAAHFHTGPAGVSGGVVRAVTFENNTTAGVWRASDDQPLTDELIVELMTGGLYLNVHTPEHGAGEIRGQVHLAGGFGQIVSLMPESEEIETEGRGAAAVTLTGAGLAYDATVNDLTGEISAAHFHRGAAGVSGPVVRATPFGGMNTRGFWRPSDDQPLDAENLEAFFAGEVYLNVHTPNNPGGEIRGQLHGASDPQFTSIERTDETPRTFALRQNYPNPFNPSTAISFDLDRTAGVTLNVFDALGRRVAVLHEGTLPAGSYEVTFQAAALPSGVYYYRLEADGLNQTRAMLLMK